MGTEEHSGKLLAIWLKPAEGAPMRPCRRATIRVGKGLVGNAEQGGERQVVLLEAERWARAAAGLAADLDPVERRANLLVGGIDLEETCGRTLRVGECRLEITEESAPCHLMEEVHPGLMEALRPTWNGGAAARALDDGEIRVGDEVSWDE